MADESKSFEAGFELNPYISDFWKKFLKDTGRDKDEIFSGEFSFADTGNKGEALLSLVLSGKKTATLAAYDAYEIDREPLPVVGELSIVEDQNGIPVCVIETVDVNIIPFEDINWGMAEREGEDADFEQWKERRSEYFEEDAAVMGYEYSPHMKVVFEIFRVIYRNNLS